MTVELRPAGRADAPAIHELVRSIETGDREPQVTTLEEIEEWFDEPYFEPLTMTRLAVIPDRLVGYGRLWHRPSGERLERVYLPGGVDPGHRGKGIGHAILEWQCEAGAALVQNYEHDLPRFLFLNSWDWLESDHAFYRRHGFEPMRYFAEMLRPLDDLPAVAVLDGISLEDWSDRHAEGTRLLFNAAFADHWGSTPVPADAWPHRLSRSGVRLDLSVLATAEGRVVGAAINGVYPSDFASSGRRDGWIETLGVDAGFRRRGIAAALIAASLARFAADGLTHAMIGVDSDNPTGAYGLYERMGFRPLHRHTTFGREVAVSH
ncbi:MAG TPA: GNAT family N-acetyltransferase [Acidimicrobiia bacterium]|jgi:GNAT superfamily N-acetyltransferase